LRTIPRNALLVCLLVTPLAQAASEPASPGGKAPVEQVVIEATRANLTKIGKEVLSNEYSFYDRYNKLNTKREYAVNCSNEAAVGSRFTHSRCVPQFQTKAEEDESREMLRGILYGAVGLGSGQSASLVPGTTPANSAIEAARPGFKKHMIEVASRSPELIKLLEEHARLVKSYEDTYLRLNGREPLPEGERPQNAIPIPR
jgi:hypothetical protein